jgi:hypothetical protein
MGSWLFSLRRSPALLAARMLLMRAVTSAEAVVAKYCCRVCSKTLPLPAPVLEVMDKIRSCLIRFVRFNCLLL